MSHIFIVEDHMPLAQLIRLDLVDAGHQVSLYSTGEAALRAALSSPPDLIVLDWRLPGLDGIEVCRHLRSAGYYSPIVFVTAMAGTSSVRKALASGANDYLLKPFNPQKLLKLVSDHLQVSEALPPTAA